ncbi:17366_t:CDS:2, partial [Acaulospora colombiana]
MSNQHVIQRLQEARVLFRSHCAKPEPKNLYDKQSWNMAGVYAETIKPEDEEAFVFYALLTMGGLHHHHEEEEENYCEYFQVAWRTSLMPE